MKNNQWLVIPKDFQLVSSETQIRNKEQVLVERYQENQNFVPNNEHVTVITDKQGNLVSYNSDAFIDSGKLSDSDSARELAETVFQELLPKYSRNLHFMRVERQNRSYLREDKRVSIPVYWVKFGHRNGSYNWVTIGPDNQVIELERESFWDYFGGRRKTEMWNYDDWVLAREGKGPQLASPKALA